MVKDILEALKVLQSTQIPTILVVAGIVFLLLSVAGQLTGGIAVHPERQRQATIIGCLLLVGGLALNIGPSLWSSVKPTEVPPAPPPEPRPQTKEPSPSPPLPSSMPSPPASPDPGQEIRGEPNKGTQSFTGLLYYLSYQYIRRLADLGFRRVSLNIWGTPLLRNSLSNMTFEKL